jgi:hypothetical protein
MLNCEVVNLNDEEREENNSEVVHAVARAHLTLKISHARETADDHFHCQHRSTDMLIIVIGRLC